MERTLIGGIALLDMLGFQSKSRYLRPTEVRDRFIDPLLKAVLDAEVVLNDDFAHAGVPIRFDFVHFADTVALILPCSPEGLFSKPAQVVESLAYGCALVVASCIWSTIPLRGALAFGEMIVSDDPVYLLGNPVLDAHALERCQEWAGIALCESAGELITAKSTLRCTRWDVPLKGKTENRWCVNWPMHSSGPRHKSMNDNTTCAPGQAPDWESCFGTDGGRGGLKKTNTKDFFYAQDAACRVAGPTIGPDVVKDAGRWRHMYARRQRTT